jgi:hypothetical protein
MADSQNKFNDFITEFIEHTKLDPKTNMDTYIQYYQARILDLMLRQQLSKMDELIEAVKNPI